MKYFVKVKYDYSGDPLRNHIQEIKTNHYYRENKDGSVLHLKVPISINRLNSLEPHCVIKEVSYNEFHKVLKDTLEHLNINITNHKFK